MKLRSSKEHGGILLVMLVTSGIIGITLGSYLKYTATQSRSISRSENWNLGIPVAEAGVEEALAHINDSVIGTNFALNGWTVVSNQFQRSDTIDGGGRYIVRISTDRFPIITSTGYTLKGGSTNEYSRIVRVTTTQYATGMKGIITKGNISMNGGTSMDSFDSEDPRYSNGAKYDASKHKDGSYAASVNGSVTAEVVYGSVGTGPNGGAVGTVGDFGWVSTNSGVQPGHYANDVNLAFPVVQEPWSGGAASYGGTGGTRTLTNYLYWSTMVTTTNIPSPPPLSPLTVNTGGFYTISYPGYPTGVPLGSIVTNTMLVTEKKNLPAPPAGSYIGPITISGGNRTYTAITSYTYPSLTYSYSMTTSNNTVTTDTYSIILTSPSGTNRYETSNLRMSTSDKMLVVGTNELYIRGDFTMSGQAAITIAPGGSLKIYAAGDVSLSGQGIINYTSQANNFYLLGLDSCQHIDISGNAALTGVIYAPNADIVMNGGGSTVYDVVGAIQGKTATLTGHFHFHYDEALGRAKILSKYNVASWREL
jgi:hypothetical protein